MKDRLENVEIPDEAGARERARTVVGSAFAEREPVARERHPLRLAVAIAVAVAALAAALSPPGRAVIDEIREAVGVERAQPGLFSLPAPGKLLVGSDEGVWVVQQDGSKRLLGDYREASWSPFGRFVVAARENELAALEPDGHVRWTLARPDVSFPRWAGSETDTRIAYLGRAPRVVAGDGSDDQPLCAVSSRAAAPAWRPGEGFVVALLTPSGAVNVMSLEGCVQQWRSEPIPGSRRIEWSADGTRLLVVARNGVRVLDGRSGRTRLERSADRCRVPARYPRPRASSYARPGERGRGREDDPVQRSRTAPGPDVVAGRTLAARRLARCGSVGVRPRRRREHPRGRERLRAVQVEDVPATRRLVLRALSPRLRLEPCSVPATPFQTSRSGRRPARSRGRCGRCSEQA